MSDELSIGSFDLSHVINHLRDVTDLDTDCELDISVGSFSDASLLAKIWNKSSNEDYIGKQRAWIFFREWGVWTQKRYLFGEVSLRAVTYHTSFAPSERQETLELNFRGELVPIKQVYGGSYFPKSRLRISARDTALGPRYSSLELVSSEMKLDDFSNLFPTHVLTHSPK